MAARVTAMCTLLLLLLNEIHLLFFADGWHCHLVSVFLAFLERGILNFPSLKIGRIHGASNIQQ